MAILRERSDMSIVKNREYMAKLREKRDMSTLRERWGTAIVREVGHGYNVGMEGLGLLFQ